MHVPPAPCGKAVGKAPWRALCQHREALHSELLKPKCHDINPLETRIETLQPKHSFKPAPWHRGALRWLHTVARLGDPGPPRGTSALRSPMAGTPTGRQEWTPSRQGPQGRLQGPRPSEAATDHGSPAFSPVEIKDEPLTYLIINIPE